MGIIKAIGNVINVIKKAVGFLTGFVDGVRDFLTGIGDGIKRPLMRCLNLILCVKEPKVIKLLKKLKVY